MLLRWEQNILPPIPEYHSRASSDWRLGPGPLSAQERTLTELRRALERAGIEFIEEHGKGTGVRLKRSKKK